VICIPDDWHLCPLNEIEIKHPTEPTLARSSSSESDHSNLSEIRVTVRLKNILKNKGIQVLGDLHGMPIEKITRSRNYGPITARELSEVLQLLQQSATPKFNAAIRVSDVFVVPESVCGLSLADLPISKRLAHLAEAMDVSRLGEFHQRTTADLMNRKNCGRRTVTEVRNLVSRAAAGDFDEVPCDESRVPSELLRLIGSAMEKLPPRDRDLLLQRLGDRDHPPQTLARLGKQWKSSGEKIRQTIEKTATKLRLTWGSRIPRLLDAVKNRCLSSVCPLTPELLAEWLGDDVTASKLIGPAQVRLIRLLSEGLPCWPEGRSGFGGWNQETARFERDLAQVVTAAGGEISGPLAFSHLRQMRRRNRMDAVKFLCLLRHVRRLVVEFPAPEHPIVRLKQC
jgi:hypothetical protein